MSEERMTLTEDAETCADISAQFVREINRELRHVNSLIRVASRTKDVDLIRDTYVALQRAMMNAQALLSNATGLDPL